MQTVSTSVALTHLIIWSETINSEYDTILIFKIQGMELDNMCVYIIALFIQNILTKLIRKHLLICCIFLFKSKSKYVISQKITTILQGLVTILLFVAASLI
jgi:uncharacterized protein involved in tolerance to divalent cations